MMSRLDMRVEQESAPSILLAMLERVKSKVGKVKEFIR